MEDKGMTRLLLVEDDPASRAFLAAVLQDLPAAVDTAGSLAEALSGDVSQDLWLLDANLPDGSGAGLLAGLRRRSPATPALAHTADTSPATHDRLRAAGFAAVLVKPLGTGELLAAVRRALGLAPADAVAENPGTYADQRPPVWDDAAALSALKGNADHVAALRRLFLAELPKQHAAILAAAGAGDGDALHRELHQLKASSGFVGAARLRAAAEALDRALPDLALLDGFGEAVRETLA
jgi:CheY-like chemotaxis protein/HPt (histidine-containing phosphotransfer) domain-containing protein